MRRLPVKVQGYNLENRAKRGEVTVFLSLVFILIVSFITAMISSASLQVSKNQKRLLADQAMYSLFGEYQIELLKEYGIFAIEGSYESGNFKEENLIERMQYYGLSGIQTEITDLQLLTDSKGAVFREAVICYMENRYGLDLVRDLLNTAQQWEEQEIQGEKVEDEEEKNSSILEDELTENEVSLPVEGNPLVQIESIKKTGILRLVMPKDMSVSEKGIRSEEQVSNRQLISGRGSFPSRVDIDNIAGKLLFHEFILDRFQNATEELSEKRTLAYEAEYILAGKESDVQNLEAVVKKILLIRTGLNYAYLLQDTTKQAEAEALALTLTTLIGIPVIEKLVTQALLAAWAFGEGIMDVRCLMGGKKVALIKNSESWQLSLSSLLKLGTEEDSLEGEDTQGGIGYKDYLRMLFFLANKDEISMRTLDRIEENMKYEKDKKFFRTDACVLKIKTKNKAEIYQGFTYEFPLYFGYEQ